MSYLTVCHSSFFVLFYVSLLFFFQKPAFYFLAPQLPFGTLAKWGLMFLERMVWQKINLSSWDTCASGSTISRLATKKANFWRFVGLQLQNDSWDIRCTFEPNVAQTIAQVFPFNCVHHKYSHYLFHQSQWNHILCEPTSDFPLISGNQNTASQKIMKSV